MGIQVLVCIKKTFLQMYLHYTLSGLNGSMIVIQISLYNMDSAVAI